MRFSKINAQSKIQKHSERKYRATQLTYCQVYCAKKILCASPIPLLLRKSHLAIWIFNDRDGEPAGTNGRHQRDRQRRACAKSIHRALGRELREFARKTLKRKRFPIVQRVNQTDVEWLLTDLPERAD